MMLSDLEFAYTPIREKVHGPAGVSLTRSGLRTELAGIETKLGDPALWANPALSQPLMRDRKRLEALLANAEELDRRTGDIDAYFDLAREGEAVEEDLDREIAALSAFGDQLEERTMLSGETDALNAIVTGAPGRGRGPRARTGPRC